MKTGAENNKEKGQVLVFAVIILIILAVATIFLFDMHSIIRSKIKLETAEQAAALAAGKWQARSLNLIGDINLVKAADTLLDDIPTEGDDEAERMSSANKTLTEMQSRISFCGPLLAFGAAQQAAKNNGINIYESDSMSAYKSVYSDLNNYLDKLDPASQFYNYGDIEEYINYYKWREPYIAMLELISEQGLAVRPNGRFPGIESVDPPWLDDESLYSAIHNKMWCNHRLNTVIKYPDSYWAGRWWDVGFDHTAFPDESEIYTLGVNFTVTVEQSTLEKALNETVSDEKYERLEPIHWCTYDSKWNRYDSDGITENLNYSGPNNGGVNFWRRGIFLRSDLKPGMFYGGAAAYAECYQRIKLMSKYKSGMSKPTAPGSTLEAQYALKNGIIRETSTATLKVGNDAASDNDAAGSVAKPIGSLPDGTPPTDAILVLPLFTDTALIPGSMQRCRPLRVELSDLEKFLIWLSGVDDIHNPPSAPPDGTQYYLAALQILDDPAFRKSGWNNNYNRGSSDPSIYFSDDYKYDPESNPNGAGWLQQIWRQTDIYMDDDDISEQMEERIVGWNTRIYSGRSYILKDRNGNLVTNERLKCHYMPGGPGNVPSGSNTGPSHL